jgi:hypothetical protein
LILSKEKSMKRLHTALWTIACIASLISPAYAQDALATPQPDEILLGPFAVTQDLGGEPINVRASSYVKVVPESSAWRFHLRGVLDLGDLQRKIGTLVDRIALPTNNCDHFGVDNLAARIWGKDLSIAGNSATLTLHGDVEVWTCAKNPVPCSRVDWVLQDGPFGSKFSVPEVRLYDCNPPIKTRNLTQPFTAKLPLTLSVIDTKSAGVNIGTPSIDLGGPLGGVTSGILQIAGININAQVKAALDRAIGPEMLQKSIPAEFLAVNPTIKAARFFDNNGSFAATVELTALVTEGDLTQLLRVVLPEKSR